MTPTAVRIREAALRVPRAQAYVLFDIAADVDRLESQMNAIIRDAIADEQAIAEAEARARG